MSSKRPVRPADLAMAAAAAAAAAAGATPWATVEATEMWEARGEEEVAAAAVEAVARVATASEEGEGAAAANTHQSSVPRRFQPPDSGSVAHPYRTSTR